MASVFACGWPGISSSRKSIAGLTTVAGHSRQVVFLQLAFVVPSQAWRGRKDWIRYSEVFKKYTCK